MKNVMDMNFLRKEIKMNFLNNNPEYILDKGVVNLTDAIYSICK